MDVLLSHAQAHMRSEVCQTTLLIAKLRQRCNKIWLGGVLTKSQ